MKQLFTFLLVTTVFFTYGQNIKLVKDLTPGDGSSDIQIIRAVEGNILFKLQTTVGWDLMVSDGTEEGTQILHTFTANDELIKSFEQGSKVTIFISNGTHALGYEVDIVQNIVTQIANVKLDVWYEEIVYMAGSYYVKAGYYLLKLNLPANTYTLVAGLGQLYGLAVYNNAIYTIDGDFFGGLSLYKSDGTQAGTIKLKQLTNNFVSGSKEPNFTLVNGKLIFIIYNDQSPGKDGLWATNGTSTGTVHLKDLYRYESFEFDQGAVVSGNKLFFNAKPDDSGYGWLYVTDGTQAGTKKIDLSEFGLGPMRLLVHDGQVYFQSIIEQKVFTTDGNNVTQVYNYPAITAQYGAGASFGHLLTSFNGKLYSFGWSTLNGGELWEGGTDANDIKQYDFYPGQDGILAEQLTASGDKYLYFIGTTNATGSELYLFDPKSSSSTWEDVETISIFPNPTSEKLVIPQNINPKLVQIIDITGNRFHFQVASNNEIDISLLPSASYIIRISDDQKTYVSRFIKL